MKIVMTAEEIVNKGKWGDFCDIRGLNPWCINEGLCTYGEEFVLSEDESSFLGLIS